MSRSLPATLAALGLLFPGAALAQAAKVADFAWLSGTRRMVIDSTVIEEQWTAAASNAIFGVSRTLKGARVVGFEYLRIQARGDTLYYIAQPNGAPPTRFRLTKWDGQSAVFENPSHDFPKRILYWKLADGSVKARVDEGEGVAGGAEEFHFRPEEG